MRNIATWLTIIFIFSVPWENNVIVGNLGSIARFAGILLTGFWLLTVSFTGKFRQLHPFHLFAGIFVLWAAISLLWSIDSNLSRTRIQTYIQLFILSILIWDSLSTRNSILFALQAYVFGSFVSSISTIRTFFTGAATADFGRYAPVNFDANDLGLIMSLGLIISWYLALKLQSKYFLLALVNYAYIPMGIFAILLTGSRTAALSILPFLIFVLITQFKINFWLRLLILFALIYATIAVISFVPDSSFSRLGETQDSISNRDLNGRVEIWEAGVELINDHPIIGIGAGTFRIANEFNKVAHNVFISITAELGMIGLIPFLGMIFTVFLSIKQLPTEDRRFWIVIFTTWLLGALTLSWEYRKITWLMLSLMATAGYVLRDSFVAKTNDQKSPVRLVN